MAQLAMKVRCPFCNHTRFTLLQDPKGAIYAMCLDCNGEFHFVAVEVDNILKVDIQYWTNGIRVLNKSFVDKWQVKQRQIAEKKAEIRKYNSKKPLLIGGKYK